jgi:tetratricopeptide (TPR) repeat protein
LCYSTANAYSKPALSQYNSRMHRLYPVLKYSLLTLLIPLLVASLLGTCVSGLIFEGGSCSLQRDVLRSLAAYGPGALLIFSFLLALTLVARHDHHYYHASQQFSLLKPAEQLKPEDFGFEAATSSTSVGPGRRPYYDTYVPRKATSEPPDDTGPHSYDEVALATALRSGRSFVLLGQPLDGKSRTLYEILSRLRGRQVVRPSLSKGIPREDALSLVEGKHVILLLEDLHEYVGGRIDLPELQRELSGRAASCVIASTCRDGPDLKRIQEELGRLYEDVPLKLRLTPPTAEEKGLLARSIGDGWDPEKAEDYPTMGSIAMERPMEAMNLRFRNLLQNHPDYADALRAMKLLTAASIRPLTHRRIEAALSSVFGRTETHLRDCLRILSDQAFLQADPSADGRVRPEPAYLRDAVFYTEGKEPKDDFFPALLYSLKDIGDADAMIGLGVSSMLGGRFNAQAVYDCFHWATEADPNNPSAWLNKTALLSAGGYHAEAVEAADKAVQLKPGDYAYWQQKGRVLHAAGLHEEARNALLQAATLRPDRSDIWRQLGSVYMGLARPSYALSAFNRSIDLGADYDYLESWIDRAMALRQLGRDREALRAYDRVIRIDPDHFEARFNKAGLLRKLALWEEALVAAEEAENLRPEDADVQNGKAEALYELAKRDDDPDRLRAARQAFDRATILDDKNAMAWSMKGVTDLYLERYVEASEAIERAIALRPDRPEDWFHKAQALLKMVEGEAVPGPPEYAAGMWWLCRAWQARDRFPDGGGALLRLFQQLGYDPRRCRYDSPSLELLAIMSR